jgi:hypothetical protein
MTIVYEHDYGHEAYGKVIITEEGLYKCYTTPLFGGEWQEQEVFKNKEEAIEYIKSLT